MPSIQITKKRLHCGIFKALVTSQVRAIEKGIAVVSPTLFAGCLVEASKATFCKYYEKKNIEAFLEHVFSFSYTKAKKKVDFDSLKINKKLSNIIGDAYQNIDKTCPEHVFYMLLKESEELKIIAIQHKITTESIVDMINKESSKKEDSDISETRNTKKPQSNESKENAIAKFCIDFTQKANDGLLPPVFCREDEMNQIITTLLKKNKANPLLIGEAGVGKSALVEGLAQKFASGNVPERLKGFRIISLPLSSVVQGTTLRGQFEERFEDILKQIIKEKNIILFIDEIHTAIGAGSGSESGLDAGNIMKPYLARGDIKCIGATTFDDYYKYMRKDKALSRRFQRIFISEPNENKTVEIIRGLVPSLEKFHQCKIEDNTLDYIVKLCKRFVTDRFFPDKAIDCLDHSCAKSSLFSSVVDHSIVEQVVSEFSDIPLSLVKKNDIERMDGIEKALSSEIIGNDKAISELCNRIRFCFSTRKSSGVLCSLAVYGPPGIGKKTLVHELAHGLYGNGAVITINGSEYSESHSVSKLIGSPPGYIGHGEETFILREIRRRPHTIILVKNINQIHSVVLEQLRQIIDTGSLTDVHGMTADFSNCIFVFSIDINKKSVGQIGFSTNSDINIYEDDFKLMKSKVSLLKSVNYNIPFFDVKRNDLKKIVLLEMSRFENDMKNSGIIVEYDESVYSLFNALEGTPSEIRYKIKNSLELSMSEKINGNRKHYKFYVINNDLKIFEEGQFESVTIQN